MPYKYFIRDTTARSNIILEILLGNISIWQDSGTHSVIGGYRLVPSMSCIIGFINLTYVL